MGMTTPKVTEILRPLEAVTRDTFIMAPSSTKQPVAKS